MVEWYQPIREGVKIFEGNFSANERGGVLLTQAPEGFEKLVTQENAESIDVRV